MNVNTTTLEEAIEALGEMREEILNLRRHNEFLSVKAEAYDALAIALGARPKQSSLGMREDPVSKGNRAAGRLERALRSHPKPASSDNTPDPA